MLNVDGELILQGDIVVQVAPSASGAAVSALIEVTDGRWPGGIVPYTLAADLADPRWVLEAMREVEAVTPIRFVEYAGQADYLAFMARHHDVRCSSGFGREGGRQEVTLSASCVPWKIVHELLHALGFAHEQARHDRDDYVTIHYDNISDEYVSQFDIVDADFLQRGEYDYDSIMHYGSFHLASDSSRPTITKLDGSLIEQAEALSPSDIASINQRYEAEVSRICPPGQHDDDGDYLCSGYDNCPNWANLDQTDRDNDGVGDACNTCPDDPDNDADGDGICPAMDNCAGLENPDQTDSDGDGQGDACDVCPNDALNDVDNDSICAPQDNCPNESNHDQVDSDGNGVGNACEPRVGGRVEGASCSTGSGGDAPWPPWLFCVASVVGVRMRRRGVRCMASAR